jgi:hypothetical protein
MVTTGHLGASLVWGAVFLRLDAAWSIDALRASDEEAYVTRANHQHPLNRATEANAYVACLAVTESKKRFEQQLLDEWRRT